MNQSKIIFALDYNSLDEARRAAELLAPHVGMFKVGLELFATEGPKAAVSICEVGPVFLDLKLKDIPETVKRAAKVATYNDNIKFLSIHADGGSKMMKAACEAAPGKILAVTVLTSMTEDDLKGFGSPLPMWALAVNYARMASFAGCAGVICSPHEVKKLQYEMPGLTFVTPGVRPAGADPHDQKRVATPSEAVRDGATYVVVGRPIRDAKDPVAAAKSINEEIGRA